jgi:hypothetical protein
MILSYYIPHKLTGIADLIWEQRSDDPMRWKILPSGKVELTFRTALPAQMLPGKRIGTHNSPLSSFCFLSGLHTRPLAFSFNRFHYLGIQMKPVAVKAPHSVIASTAAFHSPL